MYESSDRSNFRVDTNQTGQWYWETSRLDTTHSSVISFNRNKPVFKSKVIFF